MTSGQGLTAPEVDAALDRVVVALGQLFRAEVEVPHSFFQPIGAAIKAPVMRAFLFESITRTDSSTGKRGNIAGEAHDHEGEGE